MLTEKINNIKNNYITQDNKEISFGSVLTELVEFSDFGHSNDLTEEECVERLDKWVEYCLKEKYIKLINQNIEINDESDLLKFLNNKNKNRKLNNAINEHIKNIDSILNNNNFQSVEEYFYNNLEDLNEYQEYAYKTLCYITDKENSSTMYCYNKKNEQIDILELEKILKDKKFTIEKTRDYCDEVEYYIAEFDLWIVFAFWE